MRHLSPSFSTQSWIAPRPMKTTQSTPAGMKMQRGNSSHERYQPTAVLAGLLVSEGFFSFLHSAEERFFVGDAFTTVLAAELAGCPRH